MNKKHSKTIKDLLDIFEDSLTTADILSAKIQSQISSAIARERLNRGMNQKQFADLLGVSQGMISRWEGADYNFTVNTLAKIAEKLDLNLDVTIRPSSPKYDPNSYHHNTSKVIPFPTKLTSPYSYKLEVM